MTVDGEQLLLDVSLCIDATRSMAAWIAASREIQSGHDTEVLSCSLDALQSIYLAVGQDDCMAPLLIKSLVRFCRLAVAALGCWEMTPPIHVLSVFIACFCFGFGLCLCLVSLVVLRTCVCVLLKHCC